MSVVTFFVETADDFLDTAAELQFGAVAATVGTVIALSSTLIVILIFINMAFQVRTVDGRTSFWLAVKIALVGIFATNWAQFNYLADGILNGIDSIAGSLIASVGGGEPGPSGTYSEEFDQLINRLGEYLNAIGENLNWMAGALIDMLGVVLLSLLGALAAFLTIMSRMLIALLIGMAPVMIFLTLFEVTKDYFSRWLSALISFAIYPIIIAGVFSTIIGVANALIDRLGDPTSASNIGALLPFFMMVIMGKGFILATPFIARSISGNIVMPAMMAGAGGSYQFARAAMGSQQAQNRYKMGNASGADLAGMRTNQMARRAMTSLRRSSSDTTDAGGNAPPSTGTGAKMQRMKDRADRLGD